jgi:hypothetical protein
MANDNQFVKFRFRSEFGVTCGLVLPLASYRERTVTELSRMFPMSEASKMHLLDCSDVYSTFENAFHHDFERV